MYRFREPVSGFTHLAGALMALAGMVWLVTLTQNDIPKMITVTVYGFSMVMLYSASAALHLVNGSERTIFWLQKIDHAAIFLLIAGTYTPFCYNLLAGEWRWGMLGIIWALAALGVIFKLFFFWDGHISTLFYVGMGWLAVIFLPQAVRTLDDRALWFIGGGGIIYTLGVIIFALQKPNLHRHFGFHELWHLFVLAGSALHFAAVLLYVI